MIHKESDSYFHFLLGGWLMFCCLCSMVLRPVERLVFSPKER